VQMAGSSDRSFEEGVRVAAAERCTKQNRTVERRPKMRFVIHCKKRDVMRHPRGLPYLTLNTVLHFDAAT
jgi:hypothetical protein